MADWPDAPRLRDALERVASEADVNTSARERTQELTATESGDRIVTLPVRARPSGRAPVKRRAAVGVAAAIVLVGATLGTLRVVSQSSPTDTTVRAPSPEDTTPSVAPTTPDPAPPTPILEQAAHCDGPSDEVRAFRIRVGEREVEIGVSGGAVGGFSVFVVTAPDGWAEDAAQIALGTQPSSTTVYYVPAPPTAVDATAVLTRLFASACNGLNYLVATGPGYPAAADMACASVPGRGLRGHTFVDVGDPPQTCRLRHPVVLLNASSPATLAAWEDHLGCRDPAVTEDAEGNLVTRYAACDTTLVHVETGETDPWQAIVEGRPARELVLEVMALPN